MWVLGRSENSLVADHDIPYDSMNSSLNLMHKHRKYFSESSDILRLFERTTNLRYFSHSIGCIGFPWRYLWHDISFSQSYAQLIDRRYLLRFKARIGLIFSTRHHGLMPSPTSLPCEGSRIADGVVRRETLRFVLLCLPRHLARHTSQDGDI